MSDLPESVGRKPLQRPQEEWEKAIARFAELLGQLLAKRWMRQWHDAQQPLPREEER